MAKKRRGEKTEAVRDYLNAHPGAVPTEIVAAMAKQKIKLTRSHAANIKTKLNKASPCQEGSQGCRRCCTAGTRSRGEAGERRHVHPGADREGRPHDQDAGRLPAYDRGAGGHQGSRRRQEVQGPAEAMSCPETDAMPF